jgi:hypothetical protein
METKLSDYATGKTRYVKMFSIALSRIPSMYDELGSYIEKKLDMESHFGPDYRRFMGHVSIYFLTSQLDPTSLRKMFGEPILHSEFGEGFYGKNGRPLKKWQYASYFVKIGNLNLHIGYDHRGTNIEVESPDKVSNDIPRRLTFSDDFVKECLNSLKMIVDLYHDKVEK